MRNGVLVVSKISVAILARRFDNRDFHTYWKWYIAKLKFFVCSLLIRDRRQQLH
jgi:hypothetical protein